ncbi:hypothetical protein FOXYSP1_06763 [Fusarium oxysporum f. sp. phaseoli]
MVGLRAKKKAANMPCRRRRQPSHPRPRSERVWRVYEQATRVRGYPPSPHLVKT